MTLSLCPTRHDPFDGVGGNDHSRHLAAAVRDWPKEGNGFIQFATVDGGN